MELHTEIALLKNLSLKQDHYLKINFTVREKIDSHDMASTSSSARDSTCEFKQNINVLLFSILETRSSKYLFSSSPAICLFCLRSDAKKTHRHDLVKTQVLSYINNSSRSWPLSHLPLLSGSKGNKLSFIKMMVFTFALGIKFLFCEAERPSDLPRKGLKSPKLLLFKVMSQITAKSWFFRTITSSILSVFYSNITCTSQYTKAATCFIFKHTHLGSPHLKISNLMWPSPKNVKNQMHFHRC